MSGGLLPLFFFNDFSPMEQKNSPELHWKFLQVLYAEVLHELEAHFLAINVPYMPIKGAYLICRGLASKMRFRRMDDIDVLVKQNDFETVCSYFSNLPQGTFLKHKWYFEKEFSYSLGTFKCHLEIHFLINYPARFRLPTELLFMRAFPESNCTRVLPCAEDALLILLCHAFVHISFELRETLFEEINLLSEIEGFSWDLFWKYAVSTGIEQFIRMVLCIYSRTMKKPIPLPYASMAGILLRPFLEPKRYSQLPVLVRKLLFEFPFARNPWRLILHKWNAQE